MTYKSIDVVGNRWELKMKDYTTWMEGEHIEDKLAILCEAVNDIYEELHDINILLNKE